MPRGQAGRTTWLSAVAVAVLVGTGCSGGAANSTTLEGGVTVDSKPVAAGTIQFLPEQAGQGSAAGGAIAAGRYRAERVPLGDVRVIVVAVEKTRQLSADERGWVDWEYVDLVPEDRRAGEVVSIAAGQRKLDLAW
jgi:hypothetical protein